MHVWTLEIVIEEVLWSIRGSYQTIWSFPLTNVKWHSVNWPYTMTTPYWSDFVPNATFYRILSGFHRTFASGVACRQGTLTPPDTWSRPFGTCICSTCWDQSFSELVVIFPDYALRISLGTFSILLCCVIGIHDEYAQVHRRQSFSRHPVSILRSSWFRLSVQGSLIEDGGILLLVPSLVRRASCCDPAIRISGL